MSKEYNLVNRKDKKINTDYLKLVSKRTDDLKAELNKFFTEANKDYEVELNQVIRKFKYQLNYIHSVKELPICNWTSTTVTFYQTDDYSNMEEMKAFFEKNKDTYALEDEYGKEFKTWEEFIDDLSIERKKQNIRWIWHRY